MATTTYTATFSDGTTATSGKKSRPVTVAMRATYRRVAGANGPETYGPVVTWHSNENAAETEVKATCRSTGDTRYAVVAREVVPALPVVK
jgi:hypothetical protein